VLVIVLEIIVIKLIITMILSCCLLFEIDILL